VKIVIGAFGAGAERFIASRRARAAILYYADVFERDQTFFHHLVDERKRKS
jgi:hypothetical protein